MVEAVEINERVSGIWRDAGAIHASPEPFPHRLMISSAMIRTHGNRENTLL